MFNHRKPVIGYLLKTFPKLSETFILNEILELERQGLQLHIFSLRHPKDSQHHAAVEQIKAPITYIPSVLPEFSHSEETALLEANLAMCEQNPLAYLATARFYGDRPEDRRLNELLQAGYLAGELQRLGIRHLHAHFANVPTATAELVQRLIGITYSFTAHAKDIYLSDPVALSRRMATAEFVLTCTDYNRQYLQQISTHNTPIYLAYHGIDLTRFAGRSTTGSDSKKIAPEIIQRDAEPRTTHVSVPVILTVGRFCEKKGFPYLLQACYLLKQRGHQFRCRIVGFGPLQSQVEQLIQELQLEDVVKLIGKLTHDQVIEQYRHADVFVLPCQVTEDGDRDGIPNVLLEAMAMQVPVVSTKVSGIQELVQSGHNGLLVPEKDAVAIAQAVEQLLEDPTLRIKYGQAGRVIVQSNFALENNIGQVKNKLLWALQTAYFSQAHSWNSVETLEAAVR
jgi:glycosyltransferase involved in cell wall biosynthesis